MGLFSKFKATFSIKEKNEKTPSVICLNYRAHSEFDLFPQVANNFYVPNSDFHRKPIEKNVILPPARNESLRNQSATNNEESVINITASNNKETDKIAVFSNTKDISTSIKNNDSSENKINLEARNKETFENPLTWKTEDTFKTVNISDKSSVSTSVNETSPPTKDYSHSLLSEDTNVSPQWQEENKSTLIFMTEDQSDMITPPTSPRVIFPTRTEILETQIHDPNPPNYNDSIHLHPLFSTFKNIGQDRNEQELDSKESTDINETYFFSNSEDVDIDDEFRVNTMTHADTNSMKSYEHSEDDLSETTSVDQEYNNMGYSSQAACLFFGDDEPEIRRHRNINFDDDGEDSSASA